MLNLYGDPTSTPREVLRLAADPTTVMRQVADAVLALATEADGAAVALTDAAGHLRLVRTAGTLLPHAGMVLDRPGSLAAAVMARGQPVRSDDTEDDPRVDRTISRQLGMRSLVYVPLLRSRSAIGLVMLTSTRPNAFTDADLHRCASVAGVVDQLVVAAGRLAQLATSFATPLEAGDRSGDDADADADAVARFVTELVDPARAGQDQVRARVEETIRTEAFDMVVQPIVRLSSGTIAAFEALARFTGQPAAPPDRWFSAAQQAGLGTELELCAAAKALRLLPCLPDGVVLAINIGPDGLRDPRFAELVRSSDPRRVVVEITEHIAVHDYKPLVDTVDALRQHGTELSVDDAGAGYASFAHIIELAPSSIKLDRSLIAGIDTDPVRRALANALVTFSHQSGAQVVAEGIETAGELAAVVALDVDFGQGFYLGRPAPIDQHLAGAVWPPPADAP